MSKLSQQFNDMDETHLAMSDPIELAKYIIELRGEHQELLDDIENHPDYDQDERFESGYDAGRCSVEIADEKDYEIEKNKKELLEQLERITDLKVQNEKLKENSETQTTAIRALTKQLEYECGDTSDMEGLNEFLKKYSSKEDYKKFYDWFEMSEYDVEFIESEE